MKVKGKYSESEILHAVILIVAAVIAIVVFVIVLNITGGSIPKPAVLEQQATSTTTAASVPQTTEPAGYIVSEELAEEMKDAAEVLIRQNFTVLRLYYIRGMEHKDEPYGNFPEDGYYTVKDDKYSSIEQLEEIVDSTYTKDYAQTVKTDPLGYGAIYKTRPNGTLGIIANFTPMEYDRSWENPDFTIEPASDTECPISIMIHEKSDNSEVTVRGTMVKTEDGWRLTSIVF